MTNHLINLLFGLHSARLWPAPKESLFGLFATVHGTGETHSTENAIGDFLLSLSVFRHWSRVSDHTNTILMLGTMGTLAAWLPADILLRRWRAKRIKRNGILALARIQRVDRSGMAIGGLAIKRPLRSITLVLDVFPANGSPYQAHLTFWSETGQEAYTPGSIIQVYYDPQKPTRVALA